MRTLILIAFASLALGCSTGRNVVERLTGPRPIASVRMMEDPNFADHRRQGILQLVKSDFGRGEPYTKRYRQIAQNDPDFTVRAAAVRALNWSRDRHAVPVFIAALGDPNELVRWEAAKGLANVSDPSAVEPLTRALGNTSEHKDVRIAAADALRHYRTSAVARALATTLSGKDFAVAWQARWSLRTITGRDYRYDEKAWSEHVASAFKSVG